MERGIKAIYNVPLTVVSSCVGSPSSSRLTLSRDIVESRCVVRSGDLGCLMPCWLCSSCTPSPFVSGSTGTGSAILGTERESDVLSGTLLLTEEDRRLVRDRVPSDDLSRTGSMVAVSVVSFVSSKVS